MVFRAGYPDACTWDVARFSESVKMHSPAARVFLRFPKISQHPACMDHAILRGKPFSNPLVLHKWIRNQTSVRARKTRANKNKTDHKILIKLKRLFLPFCSRPFSTFRSHFTP